MAIEQVSRVIDRIRRAALLQDGSGLSDGQLLDAFIAHRDEAAFEALVHRHSSMVLGVCRRVVGHAQDAEDAFQATFLVLVRKATSVVPREAVGNWLYGVAYRTALEARSRSARLRSREMQVREMPHPTAPPDKIWNDLQPVLDQELSRLPAKYRLPVVLCDLEGRARHEVSSQLELAEGTLSSRLARGRKMLAGRLARHGLALSAGALALALSQQTASAAPAPLVVSTIQAATLVAAGEATAVVVSTTALALTEGVLKAMFMTKLKTAALALMLVALIGTSGGIVTHRVLAGPNGPGEQPVAVERESSDRDFGERDPFQGDRAEEAAQGREPDPRARPNLMGKIEEVAKDGKSITLVVPGKNRGEGAEKITIKLADKCKLLFRGVGPGGAKLSAGQAAQVWLVDGSKDTAETIHAGGSAGDRGASALSGKVISVSADGKTLTFKLPPKSRDDFDKTIDVKLTEKTTVVYSNVAQGETKPEGGYHANVWLKEGAKDTAARVEFQGKAETFDRSAPPRKADTQGRVVAVSKDGKLLTIETPGGGREERIEPMKHDIKISDKTRLVYFQIPAGGDHLAEGYLARIWLADGSKDTADKIFLEAGAKARDDGSLRGRISAIAKDGKSITLETPGKERGDAPISIPIKLTADSKLIFNGVGPDGAVLSEGMMAHVQLQEGSTDTAAQVMLSPAPKAEERRER